MDEKTIKKVADRKQDHIQLAFDAHIGHQGSDARFLYEPMLSAHPDVQTDISASFLGKRLNAPIWVSSMTGGTEMAFDINRRLATACAKYKLGMGLGSCRPLLDNLNRLNDFDVRDLIGDHLPLFANLGIAQVERLITTGRIDDIVTLVDRLRADGLIVHVNPLQEWLQPEGDKIQKPPLETLEQLLSQITFPVIVKEVGQGMGYNSILELLKLPIAAFELAAHGGTNFSKLELLRANADKREMYSALSRIGHNLEEMIGWINAIVEENKSEIKCREIIVSGGIKDFLDGYYWTQKLKLPSLYGQAGMFLKFAKESQEALDHFITQQIEGLQLAHAFLKVR